MDDHPYTDKKLIVFDLDGTLVTSKTPVTPEIARLLEQLLARKPVVVIGGGRYSQFEKQLLPFLSTDPQLLERLFLFPNSGSLFYRFEDGGWKNVYEEGLTGEEKEKIRQAFQTVFRQLDYHDPEVLYGETIEDRGTQVSFSPLGQEAPVAEKEKWKAQYSDVRIKIRAEVETLVPEFEVRLGGITTIDVTRKGIDKAYGIHKIEKYLGITRDEMLFIGDALYEGGNDYAVKQAGVESIQVDGPKEAAEVIRKILA